MKSQDHTFRSKRPDERIRRGHAPKRVASRASIAANLRQIPGFCGTLMLSGYQISWATLSGTPLPSAPINTPCSATYRASRDDQGFLQPFFISASCNFRFMPVVEKKELCNWRLFCNKGHSLFSFNFCNLILFCDLSGFLFNL